MTVAGTCTRRSAGLLAPGLVVAIAGLAHGQCVPQPPNQDCETVPVDVLVPGVPVTWTGDNTCAEQQCQAFPGSFGDVWHAFEITECMDVTLSYCGSGPPAWGNAWLNLAQECPCRTFTAAASFQFSCPDGNVQMTWTDLEPGNYYYAVMLDPANSSVGPYTIQVVGTACTSPVPPPNDDQANSEPIGDVTDRPFDTRLATFDGPGTCINGPDIWYCYTASCTGRATVSLCGSTYDTKVAVYDGCSPLGGALDCNDDFPGCGNQSQVEFDVAAGQAYMIQVAGFDQAVGRGVLTVGCLPTGAGACCLPDGQCQDAITETACLAAGGMFQGAATTCSGVTCTPFYCVSGAVSDEDSLVELVTLNTISNDTAGQCATYSDFTALATDLQRGESYTLEVTSGTCRLCFLRWTKAWIDWNGDTDFDDPGEQVLTSGSAANTCPAVHSAMVTVPGNAVLGSTRMRVIAREEGTELTTVPCGSYGWGETEDYTVEIQPGSTCFGDINGDNVVDVLDLLELLLAWGPAGGFGPADLNNDGTVDVLDLLELLLVWGACP